MHNIKLYNTLTRQKEVFEPLNPSHIGLYVCGPTVYDYIHIGNARCFVAWDILVRVLRLHYSKVTYVRNITDVDDKIINRAQENNETIATLTERTTQAFHDDLKALNCLAPDYEPRATQHIAEMQTIIKTLLDKNHAYCAEGHVLFDVTTMPDYGKLSRRSQDELEAGARVEVAPYKKNPTDFILWKPSKDNQQGWESPWGFGRPGWHIECSAMAKQYLGISFDIHAGGLDLIFPHHENEIAQSCCAHDGAPFAKYWLHNGFVNFDGEKMSKSLGNFRTLHDLLQLYHGETIRLALLSAHYRQPLEFSIDLLEQSKTILDRWYGAIRHAGKPQEADAAIPGSVEIALVDDLNTPQAIASMHEIASTLNRAHSNSERAAALTSFHVGGKLLGILQETPEDWFKWQPKNAETSLSENEIETLLGQRLAARKAKNFAESDRIRDFLAAKNILLEDAPSGTTWRRI